MERQGQRRTARQYIVELETARHGGGETGKEMDSKTVHSGYRDGETGRWRDRETDGQQDST